MDVKPSPKAQKHIKMCVNSNRCLCCEKTARRRGLCDPCYYKWRSCRNNLGSDRERAAYDKTLIRRGDLLAAQVVRILRDQNVFDQAAREVSKS